MSAHPHVLLVNPWIVDFAAYDFWMKPVGLLRLSTRLKRAGCTTDLLDCLDRHHPWLYQAGLSSPDKPNGTGHFFKEELPKPDFLAHVPRRYSRYGLPKSLVESHLQSLAAPDMILVTSMMTYWYPGVQDVIALLKMRFPGVPVILGGVYATLCPEHARRVSGADEVIPGPADDRLFRLLNLPRVSGEDLFMDYALYPRLNSVMMSTSQGCPLHCHFCASRLLSGTFRQRALKHVFQELRVLHDQRGVEHVAFCDDALLYRKERHFVPLMKRVKDSGLDLKFHTPNGLQPREVDRDTARLMADAGFETLRLSFESIRPERGSDMGQKVSADELARAVEHLKSAGFTAQNMGSYVLMGLPEQDPDEVMESLLFVLGLGIKINLAAYSPIPGTRLWKEAVQKGIVPADLDPLLTNNTAFPLRSPQFPAELMSRFRALAALGNDLLGRGEDPLKNETFQNKRETISKWGG